MFHTRFIIHHDIGVMALQSLNLRLYNAIDETVTALSLGSAHHHQIIIVFLRQRIRQAAVKICCLCHTSRNLIAGVRTGSFDLLPEFSQSNSCFHTQHLIEIGVCVRVHRQHRLFPCLAKILDQ